MTSSPFLLNATVNYHMENHRASDPIFVDKLLRSIYVDDVVFGDESNEGAYELYQNSKVRFLEGGLHERIKNNGTDMNPVVDQLEKIIPEDSSYPKSTLGDRLEASSKEQKVLGVLWNFASDDLVFDISDVAQLANKTN